MSQPSEQITEAKKSSPDNLEYYSKSDTESEEGSTTSEEDTFLSIQYPSLPYFPTPYLHNWDFGDPNKALKYITKHFNPKVIHNSPHYFPNLSKDFIYSNTYIDSDCFLLFQWRINKSIIDCNVYLQKRSEHYARYITSDIYPLIIICIQ